ncbi:MAG TPA: hypothetical protein VFO82_14160 [Steroidobacteraceae bacterium]|nr:hypothetical protein [Steroidobacteraceae bacterium]
MQPNPYAPPKASVADAKPAGPSEVSPVALVYSSNQIATATVLGTVLAGGWLMAANYRVMGQEDHSRRTIGWSIFAFVALLGVMVALPGDWSDLGVEIASGVACAVALRAWSEAQFGKMLEQHRVAGGTQHSWGRVVILGLLFSAILFAVAYLLTLALLPFGIYIY